MFLGAPLVLSRMSYLTSRDQYTATPLFTNGGFSNTEFWVHSTSCWMVTINKKVKRSLRGFDVVLHGVSLLNYFAPKIKMKLSVLLVVVLCMIFHVRCDLASKYQYFLDARLFLKKLTIKIIFKFHLSQ